MLIMPLYLSAQVHQSRQRDNVPPDSRIDRGARVRDVEAYVRFSAFITLCKPDIYPSRRLASFGGAGGQHACEIARLLGIKTILIHRYSSILSAYGLALADRYALSTLLMPFS